MRHLLDNIMWNCLSGPHAKFATGSGTVRRYAPGFSPIVGCENPEQPDFGTLEKFCAPGYSFYFDIWSGPAPAGWRIDKEAHMFKMVWEAPMPGEDAAPDAVLLRPEDFTQAVELALRELAPRAVRATVLAPEVEFTYRPRGGRREDGFVGIDVESLLSTRSMGRG